MVALLRVFFLIFITAVHTVDNPTSAVDALGTTTV